MLISQSAFDLIVREEVTSQAYYERHYTHPEWPGGQSGITIGIGYDLGYASESKIKADWSAHVAPEMLLVMLRCSRVTGTDAERLLPFVKSAIVIPWAAAIDVFGNRDIPQWCATVAKSVPFTDHISLTCFGVLVSLAYNRGAGGFTAGGDRYAEMRAIRAHMQAGLYQSIANDIIGMKRLWPTVKGLRDRRDHEAALWQRGMTETVSVGQPRPPEPDPTVPVNAGPARTKPPATTTAQHTTAGSIVVAGTTAATKAHASGAVSHGTMIAMIAVAVVVAAGIWIAWYRDRNPS